MSRVEGVFMNTLEDDEPLRLTCGDGRMIAGLEEGLVGMRAGGKRRLVIPSRLGYQDRSAEPRPRTFGQQQRLYGTVLNDVRRRQERASAELGGDDVAGVVALDVQVRASCRTVRACYACRRTLAAPAQKNLHADRLSRPLRSRRSSLAWCVVGRARDGRCSTCVHPRSRFEL